MTASADSKRSGFKRSINYNMKSYAIRVYKRYYFNVNINL